MKTVKSLKNLAICTYLLLIFSVFLSACSLSSLKPSTSSVAIPKKAIGIENACDILNTDDSWREAFEKTFQKYGVPPHVVMAIIYQESRFVSDARPPRKVVLGVPMARPSNAYGYAQALDPTWDWYRNKTGNSSAKRNHLPDAVDFIGWYVQTNYDRTGVSKWDTKEQYLAYHEGSGGYLKETYKEKEWLIAVSEKVGRHAEVYRQQLASCYAYPSSTTDSVPDTATLNTIDTTDTVDVTSTDVTGIEITGTDVINTDTTNSDAISINSTDTDEPYTIEFESDTTDSVLD